MILSLNGIIAGKKIPSTLNNNIISAFNAENNTNDSLGINNGTAQGGLTYTTGKIGDAFNFNSTSSYVELGDVMDVGTSSWSYSFWINSPTASPEKCIFSKSITGAGAGRIWANVKNNGILFSFGITSGAVITIQTGVNTILNNTWHLVTCVLDRNDKLKLYIDGVLQAVTVTAGTNDLTPYISTNYNNTNNFRIGAYTGTNNTLTTLWFNGKIDAFNVWNRILTTIEITELYNSGSGLQYPF